MARVASTRTQNIGGAANAFIRSDAFANAAWTKTNVTPSDNNTDIVAPNGLTTGVTKLAETAVNAGHFFFPTASPLTIRAGQTFQLAFSIAKSTIGTLTNYRRVLVLVNDGTGSFVEFNPRTGLIDNTVSTGGGTTTGVMFVHPQNSSWYRCCVFYKNVLSGQESLATQAVFELDNGANGAGISLAYLGDTNSGCYLAEVGCYLQNHPLQYIRTDGTPVTPATPRGLMAYEAV